uniref:Uncharacterized protein n=1 Tax=Romanomermis culicivorax TaxID=13658 RepID=A0A915JAA8_ROMCU
MAPENADSHRGRRCSEQNHSDDLQYYLHKDNFLRRGKASLCAIVAAEVVLVIVVEKRRIYWVAVPNFADGNPLKVCSRDSRPVIGRCCGDGQNGD